MKVVRAFREVMSGQPQTEPYRMFTLAAWRKPLSLDASYLMPFLVFVISDDIVNSRDGDGVPSLAKYGLRKFLKPRYSHLHSLLGLGSAFPTFKPF